MSPREPIRGVWVSCQYAVRGIRFAFRSQRNFRIHLLAAIGALALGGAWGFSRLEMVLLLLTVMVVILAEMMNTSLEFILNLLERRDHPVVRAAKDIAAGAVLIAVAGSVGVGLFLFGPRLGVFF
ncbi:MAG: diacylglycerol kinase family protein [Candidatus Omnitrophica bacterium]|nr:diacylglycerol kinase family protein [Candidatus Omnitrophota bacterium]